MAQNISGISSRASLTDTVSYCGPFEYKDGNLTRVNFPGGYFSGGKAYHYISDHQGNVRQGMNAATYFKNNPYTVDQRYAGSWIGDTRCNQRRAAVGSDLFVTVF